MFKYIFIFFAMFLPRLIRPDSPNSNEGNNDKLILKPAELVDLILEERMRTEGVKAKERTRGVNAVLRFGDFDKQTADTKTDECTDDGETLKSRKVWSRWSKWGPCSVSCGAGVITRRRACVAGRCARGEAEEQRRACSRAPCHPPHEPHDEAV
ncbi:hypothetical protein MSG28_000976 [Choristoneura fumiferana]|uniref:Uncharacterized protein n=1 Tax=Choristoneura fumiferana TaxID=7141 RepID=A0ACC0K356_CHOFU|nr:hypothetical protein MSG28_000976 [Choristoneura fumiferana]